MTSALRYRSQAPFVDQLLSEIGLSGSAVHQTQVLENLYKMTYGESARPDEAPGGKSRSAKSGPQKN